MLRLAVFLLFLVNVWGEASQEEISKRCAKIFQAVGCCNRNFHRKLDSKVAVDLFDKRRQCSLLPMEPPKCELQICLATTLGLGFPDGTLDKENITAMVEDEFMGGKPELLEAIKDKCTYGDLTPYGIENGCAFSKWEYCLLLQIIGHCSDWKTEGRCEGMEQAAADCYQLFP